MQILFDQIASAIIGATILLTVMFSLQRSKVASTEATGYYMMQQQVLDFAATVQRDVRSANQMLSVSESDSTFSFYSQIANESGTSELITYQRQKVGTRYTEEGEAYALYQILRLVDGEHSGGSLATVTRWSIEGLDSSGSVASDADDVQRISIAIEAAMPIEIKGLDQPTIETTEWQAIFRPKMLGDTIL